ncbi:hypothetical protein HQO42_13735 [Rhodococcus fascians]|nr:hypothetical protein [Rhodococcus fascians]MBY4239551.1 hypothetical protein [Rhodococcus fascians]MBY4253717.1 hypothetical protein [Rhodococcus fascians]MBY4271140.1 hypothetical protein [Rhodococcus fascians]
MIAEAITPIVEPMHEAYELARHQLDTKHKGLVGPNQEWLRTHILRGLTYQAISDSGLPPHWQLTGNHKKNGATHLTYGSGEIVMRSVHVFPTGSTPIAGSNNQRRAYYTNRALGELTDPHNMSTHRLLLRWEEQGPEDEFILDVVRPLEPGRIGRKVKSDLCFPLPRVRTLFEALEFDTRDESEVLEFEVDERDIQDGDD